jgi:hypothetical protein
LERAFCQGRSVGHGRLPAFQRIGVDVQDARSIIENLKMIRPYGGLGPALDATPGHIAFGYRNHIDPFDHIERIRTHTESAIHDSQELVNALHSARLIFLLVRISCPEPQLAKGRSTAICIRYGDCEEGACRQPRRFAGCRP